MVKLRELYELLSLTGVSLISLDDAMPKKAANLAGISRLRGADAVSASVALEHDCDLVSFDNEHLSRFVTVMDVFTPEQALARLLKQNLEEQS